MSLLVEFVRHGMLANPIVSLDLVQLETLVRFILQQALDEIARTLLDDVAKRVGRIDNAPVRLALLVALERGRALGSGYNFDRKVKKKTNKEQLIAQDANGPIVDLERVLLLLNHLRRQVVQRTAHCLASFRRRSH